MFAKNSEIARGIHPSNQAAINTGAVYPVNLAAKQASVISVESRGMRVERSAGEMTIKAATNVAAFRTKKRLPSAPPGLADGLGQEDAPSQIENSPHIWVPRSL